MYIMFTYFKHKQINFDLWDKCIEESSNGTIYALSWYLNVASAHWDALIKIENNKYVSVFPIPFKKKAGLKVLFNPVFCHQLGLFSINPISIDELAKIHLILKENFRYISNYHLNLANSKLLDYTFFDFETTLKTSFHLDLSKSYENIFNNLTKDRKKNIEKSKAYNFKVKETLSVQQILQLFRANTEEKIYGGVKSYQYEMLTKLFHLSSSKGLTKAYLIWNENKEIIYGCWFFIYKNKLIKFFNASSKEGRRKNCDSFFMDYIIDIYSNSDYILDFERESSVGVNKYKRSFNPEKVYYINIQNSRLPYILNKAQSFRKRIYRLFKSIV